MHAISSVLREASANPYAIPNGVHLMPTEHVWFVSHGLPTVPHQTLIRPGDHCRIHRPQQRGGIDEPQDTEVALFGLIPSWACDARCAVQNAVVHVSAISNKPTYRSALRNGQFCWISVAYFLGSVWKEGRAQPVRIERDDQTPLLLAGIWSEWALDKGKTLLSFCLLTRDSNSQLKQHGVRIGQGMSHCYVILSPTCLMEWLALPSQQAIETVSDTPLPLFRVLPFSLQQRIRHAT